VDRYRDIAYEAPPPPLASQSDEVVYVDSFTYNLTPGFRLGYVRAPEAVTSRLVRRSTAMTLAPSPILQVPLAGFLAKGRLDSHLKRVVPEYRRRRDALLRSLHLRMPRGTSWTTPQGGFALWVQLPAGNYVDLYDAALAKGVAFTPSEILLLHPDPSRLRLAFGCQAPEAIDAAVAILAKLVETRVG
jgi:2-aminoadipate transaminase